MIFVGSGVPENCAYCKYELTEDGAGILHGPGWYPYNPDMGDVIDACRKYIMVRVVRFMHTLGNGMEY